MKLNFVFGQNLERLRRGLGISQGELAQSLGLSQAQVSRLESGRRSPTLNEIERFAKRFKVRPAEFFRGLDVPATDVGTRRHPYWPGWDTPPASYSGGPLISCAA